jgi:CubicO group peptidase (beta-lactamase class C family)
MRRLIICVALSLCLGIRVSAAGDGPASLPRSVPEAQGMASSAILSFVEEAEQKIDALHSVMIVRHGQVVAEGWWAPYAADEPHMMFSLSKSFTSTAVGLAVAEGKLSIDDPVVQFFPDLAPSDPSANLKAMRVRDLLTMTAGHHAEDIQGFPYTADDNVVGKFLSLPVAHKPGTLFVYNTPASYMLSAIVQKVTGQTVLDYLGPRLFAPLGVADPAWEASKQGVSMGGFGLSIRTEDIARFGQLYLQRGMWQGRQLVPASWVDLATSRQVSNGSSPTSDWEQGYGFQFWRSRHGFYRGDGAHGQFCLVLPQHDTVIAITSGTRDMASVMNLVWDRLVPALGEKALPADPAAHQKLIARLQGLTLAPATGAATTASAAAAAGRRYVFGANKPALESLVLETGSEAVQTFAIKVSGVEQRISASPGGWRKGTWVRAAGEGRPRLLTDVNEQRGEPIAASGAWTADDTYTLRITRYRTPFVTTYRMKFAGDELALEIEQNVGAADLRLTRITGSASAPAATGGE